MRDAATYAYPWDIVGDPAAPELLAGLGVDHVSVAAVYHATRTLTPRHPKHRVVVAEHTASYFPIDGVPSPTWTGTSDSFGDSARALAAVALPTHAWAVVNHVDPATPNPDHAVVNAYGDRYPWTLCPSNPAVLDYAVGLARATALRDDIAGIEFEAAGWYGFDHLHEHDKTAGIPLTEADHYFLSLCFCRHCHHEYERADIDPTELRATVSAILDDTFRGQPARKPLPALAMRESVADRLRASMVEEVRKSRPDPDFPVLFHGSPDPSRSIAFTGMNPSALPQGASGMVVNCWKSAENAAATKDTVTYASVLGVQAMGAELSHIPETLEHASGIRIYHAGLASRSDLALIRDLVTLAHES